MRSRERGRVVNIAYQKGAKVEVDFRIVQNRLPEPWRRPGCAAGRIARKGAIRDALAREVWPLFDAAKLRPVTTGSSPWPRPRLRTI